MDWVSHLLLAFFPRFDASCPVLRSNTHNNGHDAGDGQEGDAGEGTGGTDRQNIVAFPDRTNNYPIPNTNSYGSVPSTNFLASATCYDAQTGQQVAFRVCGSSFLFRLIFVQISTFSCQIKLASSGYYNDQADFEDSSNADMDPLLNNAEPTLSSGVLIRFWQRGSWAYGCTRNNNFSNRSQKGVIIVNQ